MNPQIYLLYAEGLGKQYDVVVDVGISSGLKTLTSMGKIAETHNEEASYKEGKT